MALLAHRAPVEGEKPMFRTKRSRLTATIAAAAVFGTGAALAVSQMAQAHDDHGTPAAGTPTTATFLVAALNGRNEVPGPAGSPKVGDPDGQAVAVLRIQGNQLSFAFKWKNIGTPVAGHIHIGAAGSNGGVQVPFFGAGLPDTAEATVGSVTVSDANLLNSLKTNPTGFYTNLHTAEFPGGAVRGQLFRSGDGDDDAFDQSTFVASVVRGEQIYACTKHADGTFAFIQLNFSATLQTGIAHSFVKDDAGPPQWVSRDRSAVTGKLISKTANGAANIAELDLDATQTGASRGQFADTVEILRLNTVGGVAPAGACDPKTQPIAKVPYQADYVFLAK